MHPIFVGIAGGQRGLGFWKAVGRKKQQSKWGGTACIAQKNNRMVISFEKLDENWVCSFAHGYLPTKFSCIT
jgi:hypothetical protein